MEISFITNSLMQFIIMLCMSLQGINIIHIIVYYGIKTSRSSLATTTELHSVILIYKWVQQKLPQYITSLVQSKAVTHQTFFSFCQTCNFESVLHVCASFWCWMYFCFSDYVCRPLVCWNFFPASSVGEEWDKDVLATRFLFSLSKKRSFNKSDQDAERPRM